MQEAIVPGTAKPLGQGMLKHQPQEILALAAPGFDGVGVAIQITKRHMSPIILDDVSLTDHTAVQIARQVLQGRQTSTHALALYHPLLG